MKLKFQRRRQNVSFFSCNNLILLFIFFSCLILAKSVYVVDQVARQGRILLTQAAIPNVKIRQCTCDEQNFCIKEMKAQALGCVDKCWNKFNTLLKDPSDLKKCFTPTYGLIDRFLDCFKHNADSCVNDTSKNKIQKIDILKFFNLGFERIEKTKTQLSHSLAPSVKKILDTAVNFGHCVKDCFLEKNKNGFCFDKKDCQSLIMKKKAESTLKSCTKNLEWKREAAKLCDCSVNAGLEEVKQYCSMLRIISNN